MAVDQQSRATTAGVLALPGARLAYEVTGAGPPWPPGEPVLPASQPVFPASQMG